MSDRPNIQQWTRDSCFTCQALIEAAVDPLLSEVDGTFMADTLLRTPIA